MKIGLQVGGKRFDVDVEENFAPFLKEQIEKDFNIEGHNDIKALLEAYIRKNHDVYLLNKKVEKILHKMDVEKN